MRRLLIILTITVLQVSVWAPLIVAQEGVVLGDSGQSISGIYARGKETWQWWSVGDLPEEEVSPRADIAAFGRRGDVPLMGRWFSSEAAYPGIAVFEKDRGEISWRVLNPEGRLELVSFGGEGDVVVAGADLDGSGIDDLAVVKLVNGSARWRVQLNSFGGVPEMIQERSFVFGKNGDRVFFASPDGVTDWVGTIGRAKNGRTLVRLRNALLPEVLKLRRFPRVLSSGTRPRPVPLRTLEGDVRGPDRLLFPIVRGDDLELVVTTLEGKRVRRVVARNAEGVAVGEFDSQPGDDFAILRKGRVTIYNVDSREVLTRTIGAASELVDEYQVAGFQSQSNDGAAVTSCEPASPLDGAEGFVWKPNSDTQFFAVVVLAPRLTGVATRVSVKKLNGDFIKDLRYKGVGNGGRTAWQDYALTGAAYRSTYGSIQLEVQLKSGGCLSYLIRDPSIRVD